MTEKLDPGVRTLFEEWEDLLIKKKAMSVIYPFGMPRPIDTGGEPKKIEVRFEFTEFK